MTADSVLSSAVEVAVGIAGFAGIVAAIRQRDVGTWSARDRITLQALFGSSGVAIVLGVLPGVLQEAGIPPIEVWRTGSAGLAACMTLLGLFRARQIRTHGISLFRERYYLVIGVAGLCVGGLQCFNLIRGASWPYLVGVLWLLTLGFALFLILLFRPDERSSGSAPPPAD